MGSDGTEEYTVGRINLLLVSAFVFTRFVGNKKNKVSPDLSLNGNALSYYSYHGNIQLTYCKDYWEVCIHRACETKQTSVVSVVDL